MDLEKQKAIEAAYGSKWKDVCSSVDINGFILYGKLTYEEIGLKYDDIEHLVMVDAWRPKILSGIETNNGWIKIESEYQYDLLENGNYHWYNINTNRYDKGDLWQYGTFTHYQKITTPPPPIH